MQRINEILGSHDGCNIIYCSSDIIITMNVKVHTDKP